MTRRWARSTLTTRAVVVTCLVAVVSVVFTAAVALPLVLRSANSDARMVLATKAKVAANAWEGRDTAAAAAREDQRAQRIAQILRADGVTTVLIRNGSPDQPGLPGWVVTDIASGKVVSQRVLFKGSLMIAEGRPAAAGDGIVLLQPVTTVTLKTVFSRLWLALAAGLLAGLLAGFLLARRLGRPLRAVAVAARQPSPRRPQGRGPTPPPPPG